MCGCREGYVGVERECMGLRGMCLGVERVLWVSMGVERVVCGGREGCVWG